MSSVILFLHFYSPLSHKLRFLMFVIYCGLDSSISNSVLFHGASLLSGLKKLASIFLAILLRGQAHARTVQASTWKISD
jgi:hypothetical protein